MSAASRQRLAVVTGGNRGIGLEVCRRLAQAGVRVLLTARDPAAGEAAARELAGSGPAVSSRVLDVADADGVARFARELKAEGAHLDMLVNNAGVALQGFDPRVVRDTLAVNLHGAMALTDALLPLMAPDGRIVMVSSGMGELSCLAPERQAQMLDPSLTREGLRELAAAFLRDVEAGTYRAQGWPGSAYNFSKAALNTYTRLLARELAGTAIHVNAVCPGWVRTRMGGSGASRSPAEAADTIAWAALSPPDGPHGRFLRDREPIGW